jgi:transcriptional regulator with XRE-family HTH domain
VVSSQSINGEFMTTGEKIRDAREKARMSQQELAEKTGIPYGTMQKLEQGVTSSPKLADIVKIGAALGLTCGDFVADAEADATEGGGVAEVPPKRPRGRPAKKKGT